MFGFLKNKLKEWVDKTKDKLATEEKIEETIEEKPAEEKVVEEKPSKVKKKKEKIIEPVEEIVVEEKPKEIPGKKEEKPSKKKLKEVVVEEKTPAPEAPSPPKIEISDKEIKKEIADIKKEIEKSPETPEKKEEKKPGFISRLFGKKLKEETITTEIEKIVVEEKAKEEIKKEKKPEVEKIKETKEKVVEPEKIEEIEEEKKSSFFSKIKSTFIYKITEDEFNGIFDDLEMLLLENNVALEVVEDIKKSLSQKLIGREIKKDDLEKEIKKELKEILNEILIDPDDPTDAIKFKKEKPFVILFFGINGTGKTTSIAKIAYALKNKGLTVALAAADTFRAASIEQIQEHANRLGVQLIKQDYGADPAAVGFDAIKYAKAHGIDAVLIDTAGRMHTKSNLLAEMEKICRVTNPDLKIFVAESIAGNDATEQAKTFNNLIEIDGSILSKADIDEKGGTIISVSHATSKPIFYLGTGQNYSDLKLFNKQEYIESLGL